MAKDFFTASGVQFTEKDVTSDPLVQQEMIAKSGQMAVPVIDVDGTVVVGFNETKLRELLSAR